MPHGIRNSVCAAALLAALVATSALATPQEKDEAAALAARCEAVKWPAPTAEGVIVHPPEIQRVIDELKARGPSALDVIEPALAKSANLRRLVPWVAGAWPNDRSRKLLVGLLADPDERTAYYAVDALVQVRGAEVVEPVLAAAKKRGGMTLHNALNGLDALGALPAGIDLAVAATANRNSWVRWSAYQSLSKMDWKEGIDKALAALRTAAAKEPDADAKGAALAAIKVLEAR